MALPASYTQFKPVLDSFFSILIPFKHTDVLRDEGIVRALTVAIVIFRFVVEIIQSAKLSLSTPYYLGCAGGTFPCVLEVLIFPSYAAATQTQFFSGVIVSGGIIIIVSILSAITFYTQRKSSSVSNNSLITKFVHHMLPFVVLGYFVDMIALWFSFFVCNEEIQVLFSGDSCFESKGNYGYLIAGIIICIIAILSSFILALFSAFPDSRSWAVNRTSQPYGEVMYLFTRIFLCIQFAFVQTEDGQSQRTAFTAISLCFGILSLIIHLTSCPFTLKLENRLRGAAIGTIIGCCISSLALSCDTDQTVFDDGPYHIVAGVISGCIFFCISTSRAHHIHHLFNLEINVMTGAYDPKYLDALLQFVWWTDENESVDQALGFNSSGVQEGSGNDNLLTPYRRQQSLGMGGGSNTINGSDSVLSPNSMYYHFTPKNRKQSLNNAAASQNPNQSSIARHEPSSSVNAAHNHMANTAMEGHGGVVSAVNTSLELVADLNSPSALKLNPESQEEPEYSNIAETQARILQYITSQNFAAIRRALIVGTDVEMIVRAASEDWDSLSTPQKALVKVSLAQIFVALIQQPKVSAHTYLWFGVVALYFLNDANYCLRLIKLTSDHTTSWWTLFCCYVLQKVADGHRSGENLRKSRRDGISDQAAYRRWLTAAQFAHERALNMTKKFFKSVLDLGSSRGMSSQSMKSNSNVKMLADRAFSKIHEAEQAYNSLKRRYPQSSEATNLSSMFKLQFFKDEFMSDRYREGSTEGSMSSLGFGVSAESPKGVVMAQLRTNVMKAFSFVRLSSYICMLMVAIVMVVFSSITIVQLGSINSNLDAFESIANVFAYIPRCCSSMRRGLAGMNYVEEYFLSVFRADVVLWGNNIAAATDSYLLQLDTYGTTGSDQFSEDCRSLMDTYDVITGCGIVYASSISNSRIVRRQNDGSYLDSTQTIDVLTDTSTETDWWRETLSRYSSGTLQDINLMYTQVDDVDSIEVTSKMVTRHIEYYSELKAVLFVEGEPDDNDVALLSTGSDTISYFQFLSDYYNILVQRVLDDKVSSAIEMLHDPSFTVGTYEADNVTRTETDVSFMQLMSMFFNSLSQFNTEFPALNYEKIRNLQNIKYAMELCTSDNMDDSEEIVNLIVDYINDNLLQSTTVIIGCACAAIACVIIAYILSVWIVRKHLEEFDRDDGSSVSVKFLTVLPRLELKSLYKTIHDLKLDRGVFDPDDENASKIDLLRVVSQRQARSFGMSSSLTIRSSMDGSTFGDSSRKQDAQFNNNNNNNNYNNGSAGNMSTNYNHMNSNIQSPNNINSNSNNISGPMPNNNKLNLRNNENVNSHFSSISNPLQSDSFSNAHKNLQTTLEGNNQMNNKNHFTNQIPPASTQFSNIKRTPPRSNHHSNMAHLLGDTPLQTPKTFPTSDNKFGSSNLSSSVDMKDNPNFKDDIYLVDGDEGINNNSSTELTDENSEGYSKMRYTHHESNSHYGGGREINHRGEIDDDEDDDDHGDQNMISEEDAGDHNKFRTKMHPILKNTDIDHLDNNRRQNRHTDESEDEVEDGDKQWKEDKNVRKKRNKVQIQAKPEFELLELTTTTSSASSRRKSKSRGNCGWIKVIYNRKLSLTLLLVWLIMAGLNAVFLVIGISALSQFEDMYDEVTDINASRFRAFLAILYAPEFLYYNLDITYRPYRSLESITDRYKGYMNDSQTLFVGTIDKSSDNGSNTVGRRYTPRSDLLYQPSCLSSEDNCDTRGDVYSDQSQMTQGLMRAMLYFYQKGDDLVTLYGDGSNTFIDAASDDHWWLYLSFQYDLIDGLNSLRQTFRSEAADRVDKETSQQWVLMAIALIWAFFSCVIIQVVLSIMKLQLRNVLILVRLLPARMLFDYRIFEKYFHLNTDENGDFFFDSANAPNNNSLQNK